MKKEKTTEKTSQEQSKEAQHLHIHVERWQDIVDILDDKRKVFLLMLIVVVIGWALFAGISFIIVELKKSYTYSDITTNAFGTTTLRDEQKEVSYFLFNTAELWANSGIQVQKGDVISIHSSGSAHTAIHHLYEAADKNFKPEEEYFDANGQRFKEESPRDRARRKYRIISNLPNSALVMQVYDGNGRPQLRPKDGDENSKKNFYYIAQHRENIIINEGGTLYFAVNDIVLDSTTIAKMKIDNYQYMLDTTTNNNDTLKKYIRLIAKINAKDSCEIWPLKKESARLSMEETNDYRKCLKQSLYQFGPYFDEETQKFDSCTLKTEMDYYLEHKYAKAWYDDNLGSFLIVVEKNYRKEYGTKK